MKKCIIVFLLVIRFQEAAAMQLSSPVSPRELAVIQTSMIICLRLNSYLDRQVRTCKQTAESCATIIEEINNSSCCCLCSCFQEKDDGKR